MKTDFPILFVDDNKEFVDSLLPPARKWLEDHGFELVMHYHKGESGVFADLKKGDIELIVVDYKLAGNKKGDEIIKEIRKDEYYQDIIFYSQGGPPEGEIQGHLDGVFYATRGDAKDLIKKLIELKLQRATDLATFRGWIIADAIELEASLGRVLAKCFGKQEALFFERVLEGEGIFDLGKKHKVLNGILSDHLKGKSAAEAPELDACKKIFNDFVEDIIEVRNAMAHQLHEIAVSGHKMVKTKVKKSKPIVFDHDQCVAIRRNIKKHRQNLIKLAELIKV